MGKGMGGHQATQGQTNEWMTPPYILNALGSFDDDPCKPGSTDGLLRPWHGRVWLNPPYGPETGAWLRKLVLHGNGTAMIFARTETHMFFESVWPHAHTLLFLRGRIRFLRPDGTPGKYTGGAPSVLVAYGADNSNYLCYSKLEGKLIHLR